MTKRDQRRFVRTFCRTLEDRLLRDVETFPPEWDEKHIFVHAAELMKSEAGRTWYGRVQREVHRDRLWYLLPM